MLERLVVFAMEKRDAVLAMLAMLIGAGIYAGSRLPIDAMPDVTTVQVSVLTRTGGLSAVEAESAAQRVELAPDWRSDGRSDRLRGSRRVAR